MPVVVGGLHRSPDQRNLPGVVALVVIGILVLGFALYFWAYGFDDEGEPQFSGCAGLGALTVVAIVGAVGLVVAFVVGVLGAAVLSN